MTKKEWQGDISDEHKAQLDKWAEEVSNGDFIPMSDTPQLGRLSRIEQKIDRIETLLKTIRDEIE